MRVGHSLQVANQIAAYSTELLNDAYRQSSIYDELSPDPLASQVFDSQSRICVAAMGTLTKQAYDMAHAGNEVLSAQRTAAAELGSLALLLTDIVDDEVDKPEVDVATKNTYLDEVTAHLLYGKQPDIVTVPAIHAAHLLAQHLHVELQRRDGLPRFTTLIEPLIDTVKMQFVSTDTDEQLHATKNIGALCGEVAAAAVEVVEGRSYPDLVTATHGLGAYAECLDNAFEIAEDVAEGSMCYSNVFLAQNGDTPANRKLVKSRILTVGNEAFEAGSTSLSSDQLVVYKSAKHMLDFKYRVFGPVRSWKKRIMPVRTYERIEAYDIAR